MPIEDVDGRGRLPENRREDCHVRVTVERMLASNELEQDNAEGKKVGTMIDLSRFGLLWRHVRRSPDQFARERLRYRCARDTDRHERRRGREGGDSKIENLDS